ncbi:hypothetical protein, partial [uncultured Alcanivorax sp.]|uniref:hypothetical protein n=1 Tax=uncultured Alcanivorax sp. TaxID=191215 RepID=UPI0026027BC9
GEYLDEYFETDVLKAHLAGSGIIGTALGVYSPGTAYVLLARLYMEQHGDLMRAGKLLAFVEKHFPDQFQSQESIEARQVFQRLKAAG